MPVMDGLEATTTIRHPEQSGRIASRQDHERMRGGMVGKVGRGHLPIVAVTASINEDDRTRCFQSGLDEYVSQPLKLDGVRGVLDRWIPGERSSCSNSEPAADDSLNV